MTVDVFKRNVRGVGQMQLCERLARRLTRAVIPDTSQVGLDVEHRIAYHQEAI